MAGLIFVLIVAGLYALAFAFTSRCRLCWAIAAALCFVGAALAIRSLETVPRSPAVEADRTLPSEPFRQAIAALPAGGRPVRGKRDLGLLLR